MKDGSFIDYCRAMCDRAFYNHAWYDITPAAKGIIASVLIVPYFIAKFRIRLKGLQ